MDLNKIRGKIADELNLPDKVVTNNFDIRIIGNRRVIIENIVGILFYEKNMVQIKGKVQNVIVKGDSLYIGEITETYIVINGIVSEVQIKQ